MPGRFGEFPIDEVLAVEEGGPCTGRSARTAAEATRLLAFQRATTVPRRHFPYAAPSQGGLPTGTSHKPTDDLFARVAALTRPLESSDAIHEPGEVTFPTSPSFPEVPAHMGSSSGEYVPDKEASHAHRKVYYQRQNKKLRQQIHNPTAREEEKV